MTTTGARRYSLSDVIPGHGTVVSISDTAYLVNGATLALGGMKWVPFYGPNGVDLPAPVVGLVSFADGSRYGGR